MSSGGPAASSSGWFIRPREPGTGSADSVGRTRNFSLTGPYAMAPAEHREPCESRGSCTVLGAPGGEIPPGDSTQPTSCQFGFDCNAPQAGAAGTTLPGCQVRQIWLGQDRSSRGGTLL